MSSRTIPATGPPTGLRQRAAPRTAATRAPIPRRGQPGRAREPSPQRTVRWQQQRVAIALALINHPAILLADEPTGALDSKTGAEILALFERLRDAGLTVVLITHEADVAAHADRTFGMRDGELHQQVAHA